MTKNHQDDMEALNIVPTGMISGSMTEPALGDGAK